MALITRHTLNLEKERARAEAKAELEERVRLALWRMDTIAAGILAEENNRPVSHFKDLEVEPDRIPQSGNAKLHFEVENGVLKSNNKTSEWESFQSFLNGQAKDVVASYSKKKKPSKVAYFSGDNNLDVLQAVAGKAEEVEDQQSQAWEAQVDVARQQREMNPNVDVRNNDSYQGNYNRAEKAKRQAIVNKSIGQVLQQKGAQKEAPAHNQPASQHAEVDSSAEGLVPRSSQGAGKRGAELPEVKQELKLAGLMDDAASMDQVHLSILKPLWLGQDLILAREVVDSSGKRVQGVWLDARKIRTSLLVEIDDLLPNAVLEPVRRGVGVLLGELPDPYADDPMVMAALPWKLSPGEVAVADPVGWTPMRKTLAVAWVGALLAALAAVALMRGVVKLSERRASFVSSVTHELRTPLTTFSLYSDMLAEGMVRDEDKQQEYLYTLRRESARLTHLVENVLAYSRIERGSARARVENIEVARLIDRIRDRLQQRADEVGMNLSFEIDDQTGGRHLDVDTTAVEQIIFNLVDNACKYASGDDYGKNLLLQVGGDTHSSGDVYFRVCDEGPGVDRSEHRRLFRAFHKSAKEAAHSKPGVGLGLALSRRLARALGGDLVIVPRERGACFELRLKGLG
ncbi:HAMP domain-containing histidine kinase [Verrucomicrobiaceae bacterium N1E253]|uniref:histidine kinase n=1 Tax=Oceaniferula marina TaxID=2748318 RepID=A0A851GFF4_9BACT|nr:HAMP domain-containing sensor histidine kinase [Oceaniferula marina]NWK54025.1 HAMP domain-containing histidine kinase [Oceaniferula marina]